MMSPSPKPPTLLATLLLKRPVHMVHPSDAMTNCYDRHIPIDALLGASMFNSRRPEEHFLARQSLGASFHPLVSCFGETEMVLPA